MSNSIRKSKKKKRAQHRPVSIAVSVVCAVVFMYLLVSFVGTQIEIRDKQKELAAYKQQLASQDEQNGELAAFLQEGDEAAYIERIAREQRGYVYADERVYQEVSPGSY